jgi:hypothetical protein
LTVASFQPDDKTHQMDLVLIAKSRMLIFTLF